MRLFSRPKPAHLIEYQETELYHTASFVNPDLDRELSRNFAHYFCGEHEIAGADCPNCQKPLLRFLTLDTSDERVGLTKLGGRKIHCLFCWTCGIAQEPFSYQHHDDGSVSLIEYGDGEPETDFPYEDYPIAFPGASVSLLAISSEAQKSIHSVNAGRTQITSWREKYPDIFGCKHQVGGEPFLIQQNPDYEKERDVRCPECKKRMPFLAAIADDCLDERGFTENEGVQVLFHLCSACFIFFAFQQCD
ncbi:hypothetical protein CCAX7_13300 [Capsulimonas corticalis]|uniref:Uncharacterized protein n=1 Tax=Capsulimonas corticalis TaxID=2219043 RepID=A0A402D4M6_9BACT|nr:hypothetical protein [Capsulimonas corticalis]BDI29279.1 hypothetical protein CCAX7_13300 [Capsulimonas corticalis]